MIRIIEPQHCPDCAHTDSSHDSEHGCLFPRCPCRINDPRAAGAAYTLRQAQMPSAVPDGHSPGLYAWARYILGGVGSAAVIGIMLAVAAFAVLLVVDHFTTGPARPAEFPQPTSTAESIRPAEFPLKSARQEALNG